MTDHPLVTDYLRRLGQAAAYAPADGRDLLLDEVANHLRATVPLNATDERARLLLVEFGSPEDLVAEAFGAAPPPATTPRTSSSRRSVRPPSRARRRVGAAG